MAHPNIELMRRDSAALQAGQAAAALPFYAEDLVLHMPGRDAHSGTFTGQDAVLDYYTKPSAVQSRRLDPGRGDLRSGDPARSAPSAR